MYFGRYISADEIIESVEKVSLAEIRDLAERLIKKESIAIAAYGPIQKNILDDLIG